MQRILLFSDEPILAVGLSSVLSPVMGIELAGTYNELNGLTEAVRFREPDVLLLDFKPEENFPTLLELRNRAPNCKVVLWVRNISIEVAYHAMRLGVRGILRKTLDLELLLKCLRKVAQGELWFEKDLTASFMQAKTVALTPREGQLVTLISEGLKNKEIATTLAISEATVRIYLSALFRKLGVKDRYELAIYGMKNMPHRQSPAGESADHQAGASDLEAGVAQNLRFLVLEKPASRASDSRATEIVPGARKAVH